MIGWLGLTQMETTAYYADLSQDLAHLEIRALLPSRRQARSFAEKGIGNEQRD